MLNATARYETAVLICLLAVVPLTASCPSWPRALDSGGLGEECEDCESLVCPAGCTEGECQADFSSSLDAPLSSEPVQWLTRLTVGGCQEVFDADRLVRIQCDAEHGNTFADILYTDEGHPHAIDVHDYPAEPETASQHFALVTDQDGRIIESTLLFLGEVLRVETFTWDGDRVASTQATQSRDDFVENTAFGYDEAGTLRIVDTVPLTIPPEGDAHQVTYTFDEERRPLSFTIIDRRNSGTLIVERNVYDGSGTPPSSYELDFGGDGIDELIAFHYLDGALVSYETDRAPIGSIDATTTIGDNCCGSWCTSR